MDEMTRILIISVPPDHPVCVVVFVYALEVLDIER